MGMLYGFPDEGNDTSVALMYWSGVSSEERNEAKSHINACLLHPDTGIGQLLESPEVRVLESCDFRMVTRPFWLAASDALANAAFEREAVMYIIIKKRDLEHMRRSIFWIAEVPSIAKTPSRGGIRIVSLLSSYECKNLAYDIRMRIEEVEWARTLWLQVPFFTCDNLASIADVKDFNWAASERYPVPMHTVAELKADNFSARTLKEAHFTAKQLADENFSLVDLKEAGYSALELKGTLYSNLSASILKAHKFAAKELKAIGFSARELIIAGFTSSEVIWAALSLNTVPGALLARELNEAGVAAGDLKKFGFSACHMKRGGYSYRSLKSLGFTHREMQDRSCMKGPPV